MTGESFRCRRQIPFPTTWRPIRYHSRRTAPSSARRGLSAAPGQCALCTAGGPRAVLDRAGGLWCPRCRAAAAVRSSPRSPPCRGLDYAPAFQFAHPQAFELASRITALAPGDLNRVFFCNSGFEVEVDTTLKFALAYRHVHKQQARANRVIGHDRGCRARRRLRRHFGRRHCWRPNRKFSARSWPASTIYKQVLPRAAGVHQAPADGAARGWMNWNASWRCKRLDHRRDVVEPMAGSTGVLPPAGGVTCNGYTRCTRVTASC